MPAITKNTRKGRRGGWFRGVPLLFVAAWLLGGALIMAGESQESGVENAKKPDIAVIKTEELVKRIEESKGKPAVVNFWATWCPPCLAEMPEFVKFYDNFKEKKVLFLSVSADRPSTISKRVEPYVEKNELPFPVLVIDAPTPEEVAKALKIEDWDGALPATFVYDSAGKLHKTWYEEVTFESLSAAVTPLLPKSE